MDMLTARNCRYTFSYFNYMATFGILPLEIGVDVEDQVVFSGTRGWKTGMWRLFTGIHIIYTGFLTVRLAQTIMYPEKYFSIEDFPMHLMLLIGTIVAGHWSYTAFSTRFEMAQLLRDMFLREEKREYSIGENERRWPTLPELAAMAWGLIVPQVSFAYAGLVLLKPTRAMYILSMVEWDYSDGWHKIILHYAASALVEGIIITYICAMPCLVVFVQLVFCEKEHRRLQARTAYLEYTNKKKGEVRFSVLQDLARYCKHMQASISLFNYIFSDIVYITRVAFTLMSLGFLTTAIFFAHRYPLLALLSGALSIEAMALYVVMYNKAFEIPMATDELKRELCWYSVVERKELKRQALHKSLIAIPQLAVKVGSFHQMERTSTPEYFDFIFSQLVTILLAMHEAV